MYPVFTSGTGTLSSLNIDSVTGPLSYNPSTSNLSAAKFNNIAISTSGTNILLGDASTTINIQGGYLLNIGTPITGAITLGQPLAQFYTYANNTGSVYTITLPAISATLRGTYIMFRSVGGSNNVNLTAGANSMYSLNGSTYTSIVLFINYSSTAITNGNANNVSSFFCGDTRWFQLT